MAHMVRKQVFIQARQEAMLKALARELGIPEAELIRQGIDRSLEAALPLTRDLKAWETAKRYMKTLMRQGRVRGGQRWRREEIYEG